MRVSDDNEEGEFIQIETNMRAMGLSVEHAGMVAPLAASDLPPAQIDLSLLRVAD